MDIRFLLLSLLPALVTAGTYGDEPVPFAADEGSRIEMDNFGGTGDKIEGGETDISATIGAEFINDGNYDHATIEDYSMKAKTVEQNARWYRNLLNEKQLILAQVKKRLNLLRAMAAESLQSAEQHRRSAVEKNQVSKSLEAKAREAQSLSKEHTIEVNKLRGKVSSELKQHLDSLISSRVAETNAEFDMVEVQRQKTWGEFWEKEAQDMLREADKWEQNSIESMEMAKKLKTESSAESAKGKDVERKVKETEDAAAEIEMKGRKYNFLYLELSLKSHAEKHQGSLNKIKTKNFQMLASSMLESSSYMHMFGNMQNKDRMAWEKKAASVKAEAKLLETSANKMSQHIEKLKASMNVSSKMTDKRGESGLQEEKVIRTEQVPQSKVAEVPAIGSNKKM